MFADGLRQIMSEKHVTQSELSKLTGIGKSSISQYLSGKVTPTIDRKAVIARVLGVDPEELDREKAEKEPFEKIKRITVKDAAKILGVNHMTVRKGLQQGVFPWGYAVKTSENRWSYVINAKKFSEDVGVRV